MSDPLLAVLIDGRFHSGVDLAEALGVSRAAVWKRIRALERHGYRFDSIRGRGYRWRNPHRPLDAERIRRALDDALRGARLDVVTETASTNKDLLAEPSLAPAVRFAERQTGGRGRQGREWRSAPGGLYCSVAWRFETLPDGPSGLSVLCGLRLAHALTDLGARGVRVKWPNDLLVGEAKLAGILIDLSIEIHGRCRVVIGVGANWTTEGLEAIDRPAVGLDRCFPEGPPERNRVAAELANAVARACRDFAVLPVDRRFADWARWDALAGRCIRLETPHGELTGTACGVNAQGALLVDDGDRRHALHSGDVHIVPS